MTISARETDIKAEADRLAKEIEELTGQPVESLF